MALQTYITYTDVTNVHFKQFTSACKQEYVDEANDYLEDFAMTIGVDPAEISSTVSIQVKRMLATYCVMRLAEDSIGTNSTSLAVGEDMYVEMRTTYRELLKDYQSRITPELLIGEVTSRVQRSIATGRYFRS